MLKPNRDLHPRLSCMDPGVLGPLVAEFTSQLAANRYTQLSVAGYGDAARHFAEWMCRTGLRIADIDDATVEHFAQHRCKCTGARRHHHVSVAYVRRVRYFVRFLAKLEPQSWLNREAR
jgi:hypothetical protein